jgi:hypothetical protein
MCSLPELEELLRSSEELRQRISRDVGSSTVALFAEFDSEHGTELKLAGTGTLVVKGNSYHVLTAAHVWEKVLKSASRIGLTMTDNIDHRFVIDTRTIIATAPPKPAAWGEWGPDIALLRVPNEYVGAIQAFNVFHSLDDRKEAPPNVDRLKVRLLTGVPELLGKFTQTYANVEIHQMFVRYDCAYHESGDFDYLDVDVKGIPNLPERCGGVSGGGLWKIYVYCQCPDKAPDWTRTLDGVAFYELFGGNGRRIIRCHGPKSISSLISQATSA